MNRSALLGIVLVGVAFMNATAADPQLKFALALHGGAGTEPDKLNAQERTVMEASLKKGLEIGRDILQRGGSSLDAVEQVIRHLEDDPQFNAGRGACYNAVGKHELDASIMDGKTRACGAVAGVRTVRNPISLARLVMTKTRHVLLIGDGAEQFADETQVERVKNEWFDTDKQYKYWQEVLEKQKRKAEKKDYKGTVGCVALDSQGNLTAGTSTGGITNKRWGRIGDSPIVGAGTYADNATCAISCTGTGEEFIRNAVAFDISARMAYRGDSLKDAVDTVLRKVLKPDDGGLIALDKTGVIVLDYTTAGMARGQVDSTGRMEVKLGK